MSRSKQASIATSYAQHGEDIVLERGFRRQRTGFYVDVGAAGPLQHSVTKLLYDRGWSGINIEPIAQLHQRLVAERPRDLNLRLAVGTKPGPTPIAIFPDRPGLTTMDPGIADRHARDGFQRAHAVVLVETLETILGSVRRRPIDLLKIDVEGTEADVLASFDLARWAPRVLLIEATQPRSDVRSHHAWEPRVLDAGYRLSQFDGLNNFYVREDEPALHRALSQPAGALEDFETAAVSVEASHRLSPLAAAS